jgi:hypothetical protein
MSKVKLYNGEYIDRAYFENTLNDLLKETWSKKAISELPIDHVNCILSMETVSKKTASHYYESDMNNIVSEGSYNNYLKGLGLTGI